jgi:hypothetical protein
VRYLKITGLCLAAIFLIAAITAGAASAKKPEWGKCVETAVKPKYEDANCTTKGEKANRKYKWIKGTQVEEEHGGPMKFEGASVGGGGVLSTADVECDGRPGKGTDRVPKGVCEAEGGTVGHFEGISIECESEENSGEAVGKRKIDEVKVTFKGCQTEGIPCTSKGNAEGEISTSTLKGELAYIEGGTAVGVMLEPAEKHGPFAHFYCFEEGLIETVVGVGNKHEGAWYEPEKKGGNDQVLSPITPINEMTKTYTQVYATNGSLLEPQNLPTHRDGKPISLLEDYVELGPESLMWSPSSEEIENVNEPEEEGEIKA